MLMACKITPKIDIGQIINIKALLISYKVTRKIKRQEPADSHRTIKIRQIVEHFSQRIHNWERQ